MARDALDQAELYRRHNNLLRYGVVESVDCSDPSGPRARVRFNGENITAPIAFSTGRAGGDRTWHPPEPGEQVMIAAPEGNLKSAMIIGSTYQGAAPAPGDSLDVSRTIFKDGTEQSFDRVGHVWRLAVAEGGEVVIKGGVEITLSLGGSSIRITPGAIELNTPSLVFAGQGGPAGEAHLRASAVTVQAGTLNFVKE